MGPSEAGAHFFFYQYLYSVAPLMRTQITKTYSEGGPS